MKETDKVTNTTKQTTIEVPGTELVLGDAVKLFDSPFGWATVVKVETFGVHLFRPYVHVSNFSYTGGVPHFIGTETLTVPREETKTYTVDAYTHEKMTGEARIE